MAHFIPRSKLTKLISRISTSNTCNTEKSTEKREKYTVPTETIQILQLFSEKYIAEVFDRAKKICLHKGEDNISKEDVLYVLEEQDIVFGNKKVWEDGAVPGKAYVDKYNDAPKY